MTACPEAHLLQKSVETQGLSRIDAAGGIHTSMQIWGDVETNYK